MTMKGDAILKEILAGRLKNDIRNLVNFHASSRKSENLDVDGLIFSKAYKVLDKKSTEELCLMTLKTDPKKSYFFIKYAFFI